MPPEAAVTMMPSALGGGEDSEAATTRCCRVRRSGIPVENPAKIPRQASLRSEHKP